MTLRILGGQFKGRLIKTPKGVSTRPTSSLLRKAVFDICQNLIEDCRFLDLFAGSGAMGIEAISRGASHATFVDNDKNAHSCILANIELLKIAPHCTALKGDALAMLQKLERDKKTFDLVYIDPPYGAGRKGSDLPLTLEILKHLSNSSLLSEEASVFVEEAVSKDPAPLFESQTLQHINSRSFGKSLLHQYRKFL